MSFTIGEIFHIVHTCPDVRAAAAWYRRHLGGVEAAPMSYLDIERRWSAFIDVAGVVLEPMSVEPIGENERPTPIQRFVKNFGFRWHSLAYYVDDLPALYTRLRAAGVRMFKTGGGMFDGDALPENAGAIWTHPRDTFGLIEFAGVLPTRYPKMPASPSSIESSPTADALGIRGLACVTVVPRDLDAAHQFYENVLGGKLISRRHWDWYGTDSIYIQLGRSTVVELAYPFTDRSPAAHDLQIGGDILHAVTFSVDDIGNLARHLKGAGIEVAQEVGDLMIDPVHSFGARFRFTDQPMVVQL